MSHLDDLKSAAMKMRLSGRDGLPITLTTYEASAVLIELDLLRRLRAVAVGSQRAFYEGDPGDESDARP